MNKYTNKDDDDDDDDDEDYDDERRVDFEDFVKDRLRVNQLALKIPAWVALSVARLTEVPGHPSVPSSFAVRAAMLAFGDELLALPDDDNKWRTPGGREAAAAHLLPLAEAALRRRCSGWPMRRVAVPGQSSIASTRAEEP